MNRFAIIIVAILTCYAIPQILNGQKKERDPASLNFISGNEEVIMIVRPAKLLKDRKLAKLKNHAGVKRMIESQNKNLKKLTGVEIKDVNQVTILSNLMGTDSMSIFKIEKKDGFEEIMDQADEREHEGVNYFKARRPVSGFSYFHVADRETIIWTSSLDSIAKLKDLRKNSDAKRAKWRVTWRNFENDRVIFVYGKAMFDELSKAPLDGMYGEMAKPFFKAEYLMGSLTIDEKLKVFAEMEMPQRSDAVEVKETTEELIKLGKIFLGQMKAEDLPDSQKPMIDFAKSALNSHKLNVEGERVVGSIAIDINYDAISEFLGATFGAATRTQSANNIRQIGIAMHNYHDAYGTLPPPVIVSESGHRHSWRIEILPFINQKKLYDAYRFDEPWNSKHNREVTKAIPEFFKHPDADPDSLDTNYFAVVGSGSVFNGTEGTKLSQIQDGTSRTVMLIEGKQKTHWAEPVDIPYDSAKVKSALGGFSEDGANVLFCDCSVRFLPKGIDKDTLMAMLSKSGGEKVELEKLDGSRGEAEDRPPNIR